jgi:hypothetical protein
MPSETRSFERIVLQHLDGNLVADVQNFGGMGDAAVGNIGDVEQAVDAAEIDKRAVFGQVFDLPVRTAPSWRDSSVTVLRASISSWTASLRETTTLPRLRFSLTILTGTSWPRDNAFGLIAEIDDDVFGSQAENGTLQDFIGRGRRKIAVVTQQFLIAVRHSLVQLPVIVLVGH